MGNFTVNFRTKHLIPTEGFTGYNRSGVPVSVVLVLVCPSSVHVDRPLCPVSPVSETVLDGREHFISKVEERGVVVTKSRILSFT